MQLKFYTDYSLRVLMYLALQGGRMANISEIAEHYGISRNHLVKVVHHLARGGFIRSRRGKGGGLELAREPAEISVGSVVRYAEGPLRPAECFDAENNRCVITAACGLAAVLQQACDSFLATLDRYSLADLVAERTRLRRMLRIRSPLPP
jgi:Rrf2 family nitric oxide-sensitive transcriptional repressor